MENTDCKIFMYGGKKFYADYQNYYVDGIKQLGIFLKDGACDSDIRPLSFGNKNSKNVGQYVVRFGDGKQIKFAIDATDGNEISSKDIHGWADVYFKSNWWPTIEYPEKVVSIVNGNGIVRVGKLKELRKQEKIYDLAFLSRIHGGREHNIRLFEGASRTKGNKKLMAILNEFDVKDPMIKKRLDAAGVPCRIKSLQRNDLWDTLSKSKYVLIHAGKHLCISWRMIDLLCLGSSIIVDANPYPQWPQPLVNGIHYTSLGINRPINGDAAEDKCYDAIQDNLESILMNSDLQKLLSQNAQDYFDQYAEQKEVARYMLNHILKIAEGIII
jgi:hypothetical protein